MISINQRLICSGANENGRRHVDECCSVTNQLALSPSPGAPTVPHIHVMSCGMFIKLVLCIMQELSSVRIYLNPLRFFFMYTMSSSAAAAGRRRGWMRSFGTNRPQHSDLGRFSLADDTISSYSSSVDVHHKKSRRAFFFYIFPESISREEESKFYKRKKQKKEKKTLFILFNVIRSTELRRTASFASIMNDVTDRLGLFFSLYLIYSDWI